MARARDTQTLVIGAGPGGYVCAIRLAQLGVKALLVDREHLGGTCLNIGCIPSKALIAASRLVTRIEEARAMGIEAGPVNVHLKRLMAWKDGIVGKLTGGVGQLVKANGGDVLMGTARFVGTHEAEITDAEGATTRVRFEQAVIATGSRPTELPGFAYDGQRVVSSTEALAFPEVPPRLVVIGGGYIGMELGGVWQRLGSDVTVVEYEDRVLPGFEKDLARPVAKRFRDQGGQILTATRATGWEAQGDGVRVAIEDRRDQKGDHVEADRILVTVGRRPVTEGLGLEAVGVAVDDKGFVTVDGEQRTNVPHVFAIGDVAGEPMLAHKGSKEGEIAAEVIAGRPAAFDVRAVPAVVFTDPEIATVGLTAAEAREAGHTVKIGKFSFAANGRALSLGESEGFARLVVDAASEVILGAQLVGPEASDLIAEVALAVEMGAQASDVGLTVHAHPTLAEAVMEAANAAMGHAIHAVNR